MQETTGPPPPEMNSWHHIVYRDLPLGNRQRYASFLEELDPIVGTYRSIWHSNWSTPYGPLLLWTPREILVTQETKINLTHFRYLKTIEETGASEQPQYSAQNHVTLGVWLSHSAHRTKRPLPHPCHIPVCNPKASHTCTHHPSPYLKSIKSHMWLHSACVVCNIH